MKFTAIMITLVLTIFSSAMFAQDTAKKQQEKASMQQSVKTKYSCPMHPSVNSSKPGKCAKCGMDLVKSEVPPKKMYACPMHPDVTSSKAGKCPKCKMALAVKEGPQN